MIDYVRSVMWVKTTENGFTYRANGITLHYLCSRDRLLMEAKMSLRNAPEDRTEYFGGVAQRTAMVLWLLDQQ